MINDIKSFLKVHEYNTIKFIIIYIGEPLLFPKTRLVRVKEIISV